MSTLADLQRDLHDASAAVDHAERTVAAHPGVPSVLATLRTIQNRRASLQQKLLAAEEAGASAKATLRVTGVLLDVSVSQRTFRMQLSDRMIQGTFDKAIDAENPAQLPKRYQATLTIDEELVVDLTGNEQLSYFLVQLDEPADAGGTSNDFFPPAL